MFNKRQKKYLKAADITIKNDFTKEDCLVLILKNLKHYLPRD